MAILDEEQREKHAVIHTKGGEAKFPINDKAHARAALARLNQAKPPLTHDQKMKVIRAAHKMLGTKKDKDDRDQD